ncbi:MAG: PHP domain-containing protein [Fusobacterium sp. JB021]|nr:PHP domain-containing protein [Fusobacterium sp. JB021]MDP0507412.1 PHP domain-containing protein [Fusobacterium sp. JB019]
MNEKIVADLHTHTENSDGTYSVENLVKLAKEKELKVIAITDHDTISGLFQTKELSEKYKIEIINGIEMSCNLNGKDVHILGYGVNIEDSNFKKELIRIKKIREERNDKIIEKLNKLKLNVSLEELKEIAKGDIISKAHFAELMMNKGYVYSKREAFKNYLGKAGLAFVEKKNYEPIDAVKMLKKNGAFISLAHPKLVTENDNELENLIKELKKEGLEGLEVNYYSFNKNDKKRYNKIAEKYNLIITGGSDFHGKNRVDVSLGESGLNEKEYIEFKKSLKKK